MIPSLLNLEIPIIVDDNSTAWVPVSLRNCPLFSPFQELAIVPARVLIVHPGPDALHKITPGKIDDAYIGAAHERLTNLV